MLEMPTARRWAVILAACLAIGATTTVGVAWVRAATVHPDGGRHWSRPSGIGDGWSYWLGEGTGTTIIIRDARHTVRVSRIREVPRSESSRRRIPVDTMLRIARLADAGAAIADEARCRPRAAGDQIRCEWGIWLKGDGRTAMDYGWCCRCARCGRALRSIRCCTVRLRSAASSRLV